eukprot:CAMPEP_0204317226 /NCGR_PEP_ID=MMETSP0469-20131031/5851_1 /ASSEMBLY_ACC=CAM_ASM_000384 /TAXON_ID=2969 /ORGANISM="Oxyrrhis marina" /LENGTH=198 /DNA_ID=CAMNT_0051298121 /DNA_START=318 /DNA_END=914 /DNA_ORIENTATION=-
MGNQAADLSPGIAHPIRPRAVRRAKFTLHTAEEALPLDQRVPAPRAPRAQAPAVVAPEGLGKPGLHVVMAGADPGLRLVLGVLPLQQLGPAAHNPGGAVGPGHDLGVADTAAELAGGTDNPLGQRDLGRGGGPQAADLLLHVDARPVTEALLRQPAPTAVAIGTPGGVPNVLQLLLRNGGVLTGGDQSAVGDCGGFHG